MRIIAIIQARMGSSRLPGKVLLDLGGTTVLARVVNRLRRANLIDDIVVATTDRAPDDAIVAECLRLKVRSFRGSENDVLDRYYQAARTHAADVIVRITSDCPAIDSELVDETIDAFERQHGDYASNSMTRTYPRGLDAEVFTLAAIERAWREARQAYEREHVTPYFYEHPELFRLVSQQGHTDYSQYRWTLDTIQDLELLRALYAAFGNQDNFSWREAIALCELKPELPELNSRVPQKVLRGA
jgi:spore coat polysaccharide biosynthesis protein SpsF